MKILVVSPIAPENNHQIGGTRTYTLGILKTLVQAHYQPVLLGIGQGDNFGKFPSISINKAVPCSTLKFLFRLFWTLPKWVHLKPDVVNVQLSVAGLLFLLLPWPLVVTMHGLPMQGVTARRGQYFGKIMGFLERIVLRHTRRVIFIDDLAKNTYIQKMPWLSSKSVTVPVAVDTETFSPREQQEREALRKKLNLPMNEPVFVYLGRLSPEKNITEMVTAFKQYVIREKAGLLLIIGNGPELTSIKKQIYTSKLDNRILILPDLPREEISEYLASSDLFLLTSFHEGLPIAVLEALACGLPVIATDVGDLHKIIKNGITGELVSSLSELPDAMMRAVGSHEQPGWARNVSKSCRSTALKFSWEEIIPKVIEQYQIAVKT